MTKDTTVKEMWEEFAELFIKPKGIVEGSAQFKDMRCMFITGALQFRLMMGVLAEGTDQEAIEHTARLDEELNGYAAEFLMASKGCEDPNCPACTLNRILDEKLQFTEMPVPGLAGKAFMCPCCGGELNIVGTVAKVGRPDANRMIPIGMCVHCYAVLKHLPTGAEAMTMEEIEKLPENVRKILDLVKEKVASLPEDIKAKLRGQQGHTRHE